MNAILNTAEMNVTTRLIMKALQLGKDRMTVSEVAKVAGIKESSVEMMLADAVDENLLARKRHADGKIAYTLVQTTISGAAEPVVESRAPVAPMVTPALVPAVVPVVATVAKRRGPAPGEKSAPLPEIDLSKIGVSMKPLANGKERDSSQTKWGPLLDRVAELTPKDGLYPSSDPIPKIYAKAIQAASRSYFRTKGVKLRVSSGMSHCVVQRVK